MAPSRPLGEYDRKRDFKKTREPSGKLGAKRKKGLSFVVQEHHASHLHYDFRLEYEGVLKSWAVPKGPSMDPAQKRLAVEVEDHPVSYGTFEGEIPKGEYGGGMVYQWDSGTWKPEGDARAGLKKGHLEFSLDGKKLHGKFILVRTRRTAGSKAQWLLMKRTDEFAEAGAELVPAADEKKAKSDYEHHGTAVWGAKGLQKASPKPKKTPKAAVKAKLKTKGLAAHVAESQAPSLAPSAFPGFVPPQLALLVAHPPTGSGWIHELKYDGYRLQLQREKKKKARIYTRNAKDWTDRFPGLAKALDALKVESLILDGEAVVQDDQGRSDFQRLQNALEAGEKGGVVFFAFDILYLNGHDLREQPLLARKQLLKELLAQAKSPLLLYSEHLVTSAEEFLASSCQLDMEGMISKRADGTYTSGRGDDWVKSKCTKRQEFVIGGYTDPEGSRVHFGSVLVGVYEEGELRYAGRVGTGFNAATLRTISQKLKAVEQDESPFERKSPRGSEIHWTKPTLVAEVTFANWTTDGILRAPVFQGLRTDKPAKAIQREKAKNLPKQKAKAAKAKPMADAFAKVSSPEKMLFPKQKITKLDLAKFYYELAPVILPHLKDRPLSLLRCPDGIAGACFFQKHFHEKKPEGIQLHFRQRKKEQRDFLTIDSAEGLVDLVQRGTVELHGENVRSQKPARPDQIVMDFDPGPGITWAAVKKGAADLKKILDQLQLQSFLKTSGGKGLHVHIPFAPLYSQDDVKAFAQALAREMESQNPEAYTTTIAKKARTGKIFVDYLRNGEGATAVVPYSIRARENAGVAVPVAWKELGRLKAGDAFSIPEARRRAKGKDPWVGYAEVMQKLPHLKPA